MADVTDSTLEALGLGRADPDLRLLSEITTRYVARFPFTSLGVWLGDDLPLDVTSLHERIVTRGRGGYCFEHNGLMFAILEDLGYDVRLRMSRVVHNRDVHPGLTHRVTEVTVDGADFVVDVGFGPMGPQLPIPLSGEVSGLPSRPFRVAEPRPGELQVQCVVDGEFYTLYRFERSPYGPADCDLGHFYSHRHPNAVFVNNLVASLIIGDEVRSLRNGSYSATADGETVEALRAVLADPAAGDAERAAATAAIAVTDGAHHDEREVEGLARESGLPVAVLPHVPDLAPGSGGLEALSAALMGDPAIRGAA